MNQQWTIQRKMEPQKDGQRRWDLVYQCLLRWAQTNTSEHPNCTQQEAPNESRDLRTCLDTRTSRDANN